MKRIALAIAALLAVSVFAQPASAFGGLFRRNVVVQRQVVVRQRVVVAQPVVAVQAVRAAAIVQPVYAAPVVQQQCIGGCSSFFVR